MSGGPSTRHPALSGVLEWELRALRNRLPTGDKNDREDTLGAIGAYVTLAVGRRATRDGRPVGRLYCCPWRATGATGATKITGQRPARGAALSVDRTQIDFGKQQISKPVKATFVLTNIGDKPLQILGEPAIRVAQGC